MARIKVNISALRSNKAQIDKQLAELQTLNSQLNSQINAIASSWEGEASRAYEAMMRRYHQKAKKEEAVLKEVGNYIQSAINNFEKTDKNSASRIRGSF